MKLHCRRCRSFEYTVTSTGTQTTAAELSADKPSADNGTRGFFDCLVATVGIEQGDARLASIATQIIRGAAIETEAAEIAIYGNFALANSRTTTFRNPDRSGPPIEIADTLDILSEIRDRLQERGEHVYLIPPGCRTRFRDDPAEGRATEYLVDLSTGGNPPALGRKFAVHQSCQF